MVYAVEQDGEICAIAPFYRALTPLGSCLRWMSTGMADRPGWVVHPDTAPEAAQTLLTLKEHYSLDWHQILADSTLAHNARLQGLLGVDQDICPYTPLPSDWPTFTASIGKKLRYNIGYGKRLLERDVGPVRLEVATADELETGMDALFHLHNRRWRQRWMPGGFASPQVRAFHREWAARALAAGWLRLHVLRVADRITAVLYVFHTGGDAYYYLSGFDTQLSRYGLGTVLTGEAIRVAITEGCTVFDFLRGAEPYKFRWNARSRTQVRLVNAHPTWLTPAWRLKVHSECGISRAFQRIAHGEGHE